MKSLRIGAALSILVLSASGAFAGEPKLVPRSGPESSGNTTDACFDVYCDGVYSGWVCASTVIDLIEGAEWVCGVS
jgi:hypothetical protein